MVYAIAFISFVQDHKDFANAALANALCELMQSASRNSIHFQTSFTFGMLGESRAFEIILIFSTDHKSHLGNEN